MTNLQKLALQEIEKLEKAKEVLELSFSHITDLDLKKDLSDDDLIELEAFTARFARLADIFIQGTLKTIDEIELDNEGSVRDRINRAEKRGIVKDAKIQINIRQLRNKMAHEYVFMSPEVIFETTKKLAPHLLENVENAIVHLQKFISQK